MKVHMSDIADLLKVLDDQICKRINFEVHYVTRKICDVHFQTTSLEQEHKPFCSTSAELVYLEQCHPSLSYLFLVSLYKKEEYHELLKFCNEKEHSVKDQAVLTLLHNLTACSYTKLGKPLMAIMHWRKAVSSAQDEFYLLPLLHNLHQVYSRCEIIEPSVEMLKHSLNISSRPKEHGPESWCVFEIKSAQSFELKVTKRHGISNVTNLAYYAATFYTGIDKWNSAIEWYNYFLAHTRAEYDPALSTTASEYQLPIIVPPVVQITSEYALALYHSENIDNLRALDTKELSYCASAFKRIQASAFSKLADEEPLTVADRDAFTSAGDQLYHCISTSLFKLASIMKTDCASSKRELDHCLSAVDMVAPTTQPLSSEGSSTDTADENLISNIGKRLCFLKALLYFNLALALSKLPHDNDKEILFALQQALRFDSQNITMRWNVTLLLWDIGQREESIKTWCKTRNINYKLRPKEINDLKKAKQNEAENCASDTKKSYLQKDISILSELLRLIS